MSYLLFLFLLLLLLLSPCLYVFLLIVFFSQKGVECAIPHTAIYAGQELWHFILFQWEFLSVQAEITCILLKCYIFNMK